jgi:hypothetical protein
VTVLGPSELDGRIARPGSYFLRMHYTPYWLVARGSVCLTRAGGGMTRLHAARPGPFAIRAIETPGRILTAIIDPDSARCTAAASAPRTTSTHGVAGSWLDLAAVPSSV